MTTQPHAEREAVVITGLGAVSPLGSTVSGIADALLAGVSGVRAIDPGEFGREAKQFAAPVAEIPAPPAAVCGLDPAEFRQLGRLEQMCLAPAAHALADARLPRSDGIRIGLVLGLGAETLKTWELDFLAGGTQVFEPRRERSLVHRMAARLGLHGPAVTVAAACASSGYALALARTWLDAGWVDACIAGGCDVISPVGIAAFYNLRALSRRSDDPARASRPFDRDRDGFVMGEGGGFFVLERASAARARGGQPRAELAGNGMSSDAAPMVFPNTDPTHAPPALSR
ncbi:MAG: beta-ketoacyl synthase N-terminal-like domain-containing protein, partial [Planctomycetaceae bacterium]